MRPLKRVKAWLRRPSIGSLRKSDTSFHRQWRDLSDPRDNAQYRIPDGEELSLAGIIVVEAFTPSTIQNLMDALPSMADAPAEIAQEIRASRSTSTRREWRTLPPILPQSSVAGPFGFRAALPHGIEAAWLSIDQPTPSLTVIVATFTVAETRGDLAPELRAIRATYADDPKLVVRGRLAHIRSRVPWARPKDMRVTRTILDVRAQHARAVQSHVEAVRTECQNWLTSRARGMFGGSGLGDHPYALILLTGQAEPFAKQPGPNWLGPAGLGAPTYWASPQLPQWRLAIKDGRWTFAARRSVAYPLDQATSGPPSNWDVSQRVHEDLSRLLSLWAASQALLVGEKRLSRIRDSARPRRRTWGVVREARRVEEFLLTQAFDAISIARDLARLSDDEWAYRWEVPPFTVIEPFGADRPSTEASSGATAPEAALSDVPEENKGLLGTQIRSFHRIMSAQLLIDVEATRQTLVAYAQLAGVESNTRLQRVVVALAVLAILISVASAWFHV